MQQKTAKKKRKKKKKTLLDQRTIPVYSASTTVVPTRSCQCFNLSRLCWQQTLETMEIRLVVSAASLSLESRPTVTLLSTCANLMNDWWTVTTSPWQTVASTAPSLGTIPIVMQKSPRLFRATGCETLVLPFVDIQIKIHHYAFNSGIHPLFPLFS